MGAGCNTGASELPGPVLLMAENPDGIYRLGRFFAVRQLRCDAHFAPFVSFIAQNAPFLPVLQIGKGFDRGALMFLQFQQLPDGRYL